MGTNVVVEHAMNETAEPTLVYDHPQWDWEEPPTTRFSPPLEMPADSGFHTDQLGAPLDVCCPADSICRLIDDFAP